MSTDISPPYSQTHVEPVNGYPSDNKRCDDSSVPAKYDDLVRNSALFWEKLRAFLGLTSKTLKSVSFLPFSHFCETFSFGLRLWKKKPNFVCLYLSRRLVRDLRLEVLLYCLVRLKAIELDFVAQ
jgi:hypothetical protein